MNKETLAEIYEEAADHILIHGLPCGAYGEGEQLCVMLSLRRAEEKVTGVNRGINLYALLRALPVPFAKVTSWSDDLATTEDGWSVVRDALLECAKDLRSH